MCGLVVLAALPGGENGFAVAEGAAKGATSKPGGVCRREVIEGEVRAGESFSKAIGGALEVRLEALSWGSGWLLRVMPVTGVRLARDYAELATPPYDSVSPLLLSTDFSFRAQDAVAWNPRRFRFASSAAEYQRLAAVYGRLGKGTTPSVAVETELATLVSQSPEGVLQILDARLAPGTANQARTAAMVASHFDTTAHTVEEPSQGKGTALGKLTWVRFRIILELPRDFRPSPGLKLESHPCFPSSGTY